MKDINFIGTDKTYMKEFRCVVFNDSEPCCLFVPSAAQDPVGCPYEIEKPNWIAIKGVLDDC